MRQSELESMVTRLVSFRTIQGRDDEKRDCLTWIASACIERASAPPEVRLIGDAPYVYAEHPATKLLWFAHVDVVPGDEAQYTVTRDGDTLRGRGVKDMKGAAAPFLLAFRDACAEGDPPPVSILLTSDEEIAGRSITMLLKSGIIHAPIAFTPDTGSSPGVVVEHKGALWIDLIVEGQSGHGALPWSSRNPNFLLADALQRLQAAFPAGTESDWKLTVSPTMLHGSEAINTIPAQVSCVLDVRYPPSEFATESSVLRALSSVLPEFCTLKIRDHAVPLLTDPSHPCIQNFLSIVESVEGARPPLHREHGATDARHFASASIPAFLYGPRGGDIHGANEWVSLSSLEDQYRIYRKLFTEMECW